MKYNLDMTLKNINAEERCYSVMDKYLPGMREKLTQNPLAENLSLRKIAEYTKGMISEDVLQKIEEEWKPLNDGSLSPAEKEKLVQYQEIERRRKQKYEKEGQHSLEEKQASLEGKQHSLDNAYDAIYPGKVWLDTNGNRIQAHGGAVYYEDGTYYWYGENKEFTTGTTDIWSWGIRCYRSKDLCNWEDLGLIIKPNLTDPESGLFPDAYVDRPHIIKCENTGKYVCWIKLSGQMAGFLVLTADAFLGPYEVVQEYYRPFEREVGDFDIFVEKETGKAWLFETSCFDGIFGMELSKDFCSVKRMVSEQYQNLKPPFTREGIALFAYQDKKYLVTSGMTGYIPNQSDAAVSESWEQPFESIGDPHVEDESMASFNSQISQIFQIPGTDTLVAIADRWMPEHLLNAELADGIRRSVASSNGLEGYSITAEEKAEIMKIQAKDLGNCNTSISDYVWLPVTIEDGKVCIRWMDKWNPFKKETEEK